MKPSKAMARKRAEIIIRVQSGQMTATEAARELGVSRKTYYKWEERGLDALVTAVSDRSPGRPSNPEDPEKAAMERSLLEMQRQLLLAEQRADIRDCYISSEELTRLDRIQKMLEKKKRDAGNDRDPDGGDEIG